MKTNKQGTNVVVATSFAVRCVEMWKRRFGECFEPFRKAPPGMKNKKTLRGTKAGLKRLQFKAIGVLVKKSVANQASSRDLVCAFGTRMSLYKRKWDTLEEEIPEELKGAVAGYKKRRRTAVEYKAEADEFFNKQQKREDKTHRPKAIQFSPFNFRHSIFAIQF